MSTRRLTAEEAADAEVAAQTTAAKTAPASTAAPAAAGPVTLATPPFVDAFQVPLGETTVTVTPTGVQLDTATAQAVREAARRSGLQLRTL